MPDNWQHLAEQASKEMDTDKLIMLVTELNRVLQENEEFARQSLNCIRASATNEETNPLVGRP